MTPQPPPCEFEFETWEEFLATQRCVMKLPLKTGATEAGRVCARDYVKLIIQNATIERTYRTAPELSVEEDVEHLLPSYVKEHNRLLDWQLREVRRWAMQRYAFHLAAAVNKQRVDQHLRGEHLWVDFALPRIGFAMLMGYGVMLGAGDTVKWLGEFSGWTYALLLAACAAAVFGLIRVNVQRQIGRGHEANNRSMMVWAICCGWALAGVGVIRLLSKPSRFHLGQAILCSAVAVLLGIVGQFFFTGNKSMAEPL